MRVRGMVVALLTLVVGHPGGHGHGHVINAGGGWVVVVVVVVLLMPLVGWWWSLHC